MGQVIPTNSELEADTWGILRAQMERLEAANEQRKLDPRNGGNGEVSKASTKNSHTNSNTNSTNSTTTNNSTNSTIKKKKKKKISPMIESINDLRRRYEALDEESQDGDTLLGFVNQPQHVGSKNRTASEVEQWVEALPDLNKGITGGIGRGNKNGNKNGKQNNYTDEIGKVLSLTETVLEHPQVTARTMPEQGAMVSKTLKERRRELLNASTTLMSRQLRSMIDLSIEQFVQFFENQFSNETPENLKKEKKKIKRN